MITVNDSIKEVRVRGALATIIILFACISALVLGLQGCASSGGTGGGGSALGAIHEGVQKIQYLKPVVDGIFTSLCAAGGSQGGVIGAGACAAYPLISAGVSGVLALTDSAVQASQDPTALNQQQLTNQASSVAQTAAVLATLYEHPEQAEQLVSTMKATTSR